MPDLNEQDNLWPDCGRRTEIGEWPLRCHGVGPELGPFSRGDPGINAQEKVIVLENERTGHIRIPGRGDRPVHPKLAADGYVRRELKTMADIRRVERATKTIHEASNYDKNSVTAEKDTGSR